MTLPQVDFMVRAAGLPLEGLWLQALLWSDYSLGWRNIDDGDAMVYEVRVTKHADGPTAFGEMRVVEHPEPIVLRPGGRVLVDEDRADELLRYGWVALRAIHLDSDDRDVRF